MFEVFNDDMTSDRIWWKDCGNGNGLFCAEIGFCEFVIQMNRKQLDDFKNLCSEFLKNPSREILEANSLGNLWHQNLAFYVQKKNEHQVDLKIFDEAAKFVFTLWSGQIQKLIDSIEGET